MILVIDNYDSFTYNLVQQIEALGEVCEVFANDKITIGKIEQKKPEKIIISPGPGSPKDAGISLDVVKHFYQSIPILGVCLGHQCIGVVFGAQLTHAKKVMHGKTSMITHQNSKLFQGMNTSITVARYHSLAIDEVIDPLYVTARSEDGTVMAIEHQEYSLFGVQFHPESFLTLEGEKIMRNFLK